MTPSTLFIALILFTVSNLVFRYWRERYILKSVNSLKILKLIDNVANCNVKEIQTMCDEVVKEFPYFASTIDALYSYYYALDVLKTECSHRTHAGLNTNKLQVMPYLMLYNQTPTNATAEMILSILAMRVKILAVINYPSVNKAKKIYILTILSKTPEDLRGLFDTMNKLHLIHKGLGLTDKCSSLYPKHQYAVHTR